MFHDNQFSILFSIYLKENPKTLRQSFNSIFNQTIGPSEVVLVEDGPLTHELYEVIEEYSQKHPELKVVKLSKNTGLGNALNVGLKQCSHELVARMDTDDIAKPSRFEKQLKVFKEHPEYDIVGAWVDEFEGVYNNVKSTRKLPQYHNEIYNYAKKRNPINHPVVMFRKSAVESAGGYKHFAFFEDYYLWVRMLLNGSKFYNIQESLLYFRSSPDMFKRRGGFSYACIEAKFFWHIYKIGFIDIKQMIINIFSRFTTRIIPNKLRSYIYKKVLR